MTENVTMQVDSRGVATITFDRPRDPTVHVLDHNGCRTGRTLPVREGQLEIDGAKDRTCYYLVEYR